MSERPPYAVQAVLRGPGISQFDLTVGLVILFLLTVALLPIW